MKTREITDEDLLIWEAYAIPGPFGRPDHAHVVFHCVTEPGLRARFVELDMDLTRGGEFVAGVSGQQLLELFHSAADVS